MLIQEGADIETRNFELLSIALRNGDIKILKILFHQGSDIH